MLYRAEVNQGETFRALVSFARFPLVFRLLPGSFKRTKCVWLQRACGHCLLAPTAALHPIDTSTYN